MLSSISFFRTVGYLWLGFVCCTYAFFPQQWKEDTFGHGGVSHIAQTDQAFTELAAKYFPFIKELTDSMKHARDTISDANAEVDDDQDHSALHFDGENFDGGQNRLVDLKNKVVDALKGDNRGAARKSLGNALHTLQDFYAHSNWLELGNTNPNPDLGRGPSISHAAFSDPTCKDCGDLKINTPMFPGGVVTFDCPDCTSNVLTSGGLLTSGYYFGEDSPPKGTKIPSYKCHHGGATDSPLGGVIGFLQQIPYGGINKDSLNCVFSPHSYAHRQAVQLSIDATKQYIDDIKALISESQLKDLFGVGPTLAFAIDTTSSMSDVIAAVREQAISIAEERLGTPDEASLYIISPFNDPTTGPVSTTSDFDTFKSVISGLGAEGGGDCPELAMTGLAAALDYVDEGASLFLFTDAEAKDADLAEAVEANAKSLNVNIYPFKFDSDCDDSASLKKRQDPLADSVYGAVALATGGQYHSLPRPQANNITGLLGPVTKTNTVYIMKISDATCSAKTYEFPIDAELSEFSMYVRGVNTSITVTKPDGSTLDLSSSAVSATILEDSKFITVKTPIVGSWAIKISSPKQFTIDVIGVSILQLSSFRFVQIAGRPGHTGYFPIIGPPAYDHDVAAVARIEGAKFNDAKFDFRNPSGEILLSPAFKAGSGEYGEPPVNSFFGVFKLKPASALAYVSGKDASGALFQRVLPSLITPYESNTLYTGISNATSYTFQNFTSIPTVPKIANVTVVPPHTNSTSAAECPTSHTSKPKYNTTTSAHSLRPTGGSTFTPLRNHSSALVNTTAGVPRPGGSISTALVNSASGDITKTVIETSAVSICPACVHPASGDVTKTVPEPGADSVSTTLINPAPGGISTSVLEPGTEPVSSAAINSVSKDIATGVLESGTGAEPTSTIVGSEESLSAVVSVLEPTSGPVSIASIIPLSDNVAATVSAAGVEPASTAAINVNSVSETTAAGHASQVPTSTIGAPVAVFTGGVTRLRDHLGFAAVLGAIVQFAMA